MSAERTAPSRRPPLLLLAWLLLSLGLVVSLRARTDIIVRNKLPGSSIIYVPSGKFLKYATFGYSSLAADLVYLWSIQYYGTPTIDDRFKHLDHIYGIISELDPLYTDPYEVGALIAVYDARDPALALKILDLGAEKNPGNWVFPFNAGHVAMMQMKDFELAEKYFTKCMAIPGAPPFVARLRANAIFRKGDTQTAWETWLEIYNTAPDELTRQIASNHLYNIKQTADTAALAEAVRKYRERYRRLPAGLEDLRRAGIVPEIPKDLDGRDYVYDPQTGEVKAPVIPWKR